MYSKLSIVCFKLMSLTMLPDGNFLMCLWISSSNPSAVGLNTHEGFSFTHVPLGKAFDPGYSKWTVSVVNVVHSKMFHMRAT